MERRRCFLSFTFAQNSTSASSTTLHSYNRPEDDFATREEYDDYLEQREDLSAWEDCFFLYWFVLRFLP